MEKVVMKKFSLALALAVLSLAAGGTARAQSPVLGQPYQVPAGYEGYGAGTVISYGGSSYVIQADRTMLLTAAPTTYYQSYYQAPATYWQPVPSYGYTYRPGWGFWGWGGYRHCHFRRHYCWF
jgi:hypothetical protein